MDDKLQIPYYPYRDDGEIIHEVLEEFAHNLVDKYEQYYNFLSFA